MCGKFSNWSINFFALEMEFNGEKWVIDPTAQTMTPLFKKKQEVIEVDEKGNKKTKTTYEKSNNMINKKWGGWI